MGPLGSDSHGCAPIPALGCRISPPSMALQPMEEENSSTVVFWDFPGQELLVSAAPDAAAAGLRLQKAFWGMFP